MEVSNALNMDSIRQKLSVLGAGRRLLEDPFFASCSVTKVYSEPIDLTELYPEDYVDIIDLKRVNEQKTVILHLEILTIEDYVDIIEARDVPCQVPGCPIVCKSLLDYDSHYNSAHRYTCSQCKRRLPTAHLLDLHLSEVHDSFFAVLSQRIPSFSCYVPECKIKFQTPDERHKHCVEDHKFPGDFKYEVQDHKKKKRKGKKDVRAYKAQKSSKMDDSSEFMEFSPDDRKIIQHFNFGKIQRKSFETPWYERKNGGDRKKSSKAKKKTSDLDSDNVMTELKESLNDIERKMD